MQAACGDGNVPVKAARSYQETDKAFSPDDNRGQMRSGGGVTRLTTL